MVTGFVPSGRMLGLRQAGRILGSRQAGWLPGSCQAEECWACAKRDGYWVVPSGVITGLAKREECWVCAKREECWACAKRDEYWVRAKRDGYWVLAMSAAVFLVAEFAVKREDEVGRVAVTEAAVCAVGAVHAAQVEVFDAAEVGFGVVVGQACLQQAV